MQRFALPSAARLPIAVQYPRLATRVTSKHVLLAASALAALLAFASDGDAQQRSMCLAGKLKCVAKKESCILKVIAKGYRTGAIDAPRLQRCTDKFDGAANPSRGCFAKLEAENAGPCVTFDDTAALEAKVDAFAADVQEELDPGSVVDLNACTATKLKCARKKARCILIAHSKAAKTRHPPDPLLLQKCRDKFDGGADPTKGCFEKAEAKGGCVTSDDTAALEAKVDAFDLDVRSELLGGGGAGCNAINNRRCTGNTRCTCTTNADCIVAGCGGTCEFYFGSYWPVSAGGLATCLGNQFNGPVSGTFNELTGASAGSASLRSNVYLAASADKPCPRCNGDGAKNDGVRLGTCDSGSNAGLPCDANGTSPIETFGTTSLDCPPSGFNIAGHDINLSYTTATATATLSAASPACRHPDFTTLACFCDTCNNANAEPCFANADCPDPAGPIGPMCGPGPGVSSKPNDCDDSTCSPDGGNEGTCAAGPFEQFCSPVETYRRCVTNADCPFAGDTCALGKFRDCFTDNGLVGASVNASGVADLPVNHQADPTLASLFCIKPTAAAAVNAVAGLPGLARLELPGHATDNGDDTSCPTVVDFVPSAGSQGVLDRGWTGQSHDAQLIDCGLVTVSVTGCSIGTQPDCGVCTYTGPIANPGAP